MAEWTARQPVNLQAWVRILDPAPSPGAGRNPAAGSPQPSQDEYCIVKHLLLNNKMFGVPIIRQMASLSLQCRCFLPHILLIYYLTLTSPTDIETHVIINNKCEVGVVSPASLA